MATNTNPFYTYSATAGSSKTLQKPQDGGDNNQWGNYINTDLDEIVSAVNALSDKIADASENTLVDFTATGSAVNHVGITNAATGNPPQISSAGSDTNVDLTLTAKGTGDINLTPGTNGDVNIPASKGITFGDDGEKIEGDGTDLTIASSNDLNLTATTDINVPANVGVTFGDDGEKIEGDGTDLTIASSATLNVNTGSSSGNNLKVNTSQLVVEGDTGNVLVGTDNSTPGVGDTDAGISLRGTSGAFFSRTLTDTSSTAYFNRSSADGNIVSFLKDGSAVGSIGTGSGDLSIGTGDTGIRFNDEYNTLLPVNTSTNALADDSISLGLGVYRFKDLYLSGGVYLGGTGSANKISDYEEGSWSPTISFSTGTFVGQYTKIGREVTVYFKGTSIVFPNSSGTTVVVNGLPFALDADHGTGVVYNTGSFNWYSYGDSRPQYLSSNSVYFYRADTGAGLLFSQTYGALTGFNFIFKYITS